ncbi:MAG: glutamine--fructose-6-phosphate transaminase (isomerizing) [Oscillospiraceae bacterium]|jgi:glucosamine--fructose-6-phosphate aminotransferase (isomerizing)|nr:glutamine--fructose-6-phosphate transaminase (isomerizing) [Oscillospiraceae bacterium]
MCGIVGYVGESKAAPLLLDGLRALEYRGYDSAGAALMEDGAFTIVRRAGRVEQLSEPLAQLHSAAKIGIAHTRWATHGAPTEINAHPHISADGRWAVVHNGIIENADALRAELETLGIAFDSETDTEIIPQLLGRVSGFEDAEQGTPLDVLLDVLPLLEGSWALGILCANAPDKLLCACQGSPLLVGEGEDGLYLASDYAAFGENVHKVYRMTDGEIGVLTRDGAAFYDSRGQALTKPAEEFSHREQGGGKGSYTHFMRKEIDEQPLAVSRTLEQFFGGALHAAAAGDFRLPCQLPHSPRKVWLVACGSAYHACVSGKYVIEELARIPCEAVVASEFRYQYPLIGEEDLAVFVSQSGETADTLAAVREASARGAATLGVVNVAGSAIARACDAVLPTLAGAEIAVATTKAYSAQLAVLYALALHFAKEQAHEEPEFEEALRRLPESIQAALSTEDAAKAAAEQIAGADHAYFIGRNLDYAAALEGSLKLKEISYLHSEAYPAGELKHGTISLIEAGTPVIALACCERLLPKTAANIREVAARGARVFAVCARGNGEHWGTDSVISLQATHPLLMPSVEVIPLQLLSYHVARIRGCDIDKPKNLAKSVTVE